MKNNMNTSRRIPLKQATREYIERQRLGEDRLDKFEQMLSAKRSVDSTAVASLDADKHQGAEGLELGRPMPLSACWITSRRLLAIAASLVLLLMASLLLYPTGPSMGWKIADEVAMNHINMKPLEVKSADVDRLRRYFTELDFTLAKPKPFAGQDNILLGGRYCSIQGLTAAQLRLEDTEGNRVSQFEVQYDPQVYGELPQTEQGEEPLDIVVRGVKVTIWVEKGLLMAQARAVD